MTDGDKYLLEEKDSNLIRSDERGLTATITESDKQTYGVDNAQHIWSGQCATHVEWTMRSTYGVDNAQHIWSGQCAAQQRNCLWTADW